MPGSVAKKFSADLNFRFPSKLFSSYSFSDTGEEEKQKMNDHVMIYKEHVYLIA